MRSTRSNTIPDNTFIFGIPTEILQHMMKFLPSADLASLSETCRRFRDISDPILLKNVVVMAKKTSSLDPLKKLGKNVARKLLVRSVTISGRVHSLERVIAFNKVLLGIIPKLSNLTSLSIPFSFLSTESFRGIYSYQSISTLRLSTRVSSKQLNALNLHEDPLPPLPHRPAPLVVPRIEVTIFSGEGGKDIPLLGSLIDFLRFYGVAIKGLEVGSYCNGVGFHGDDGRLASRVLPELLSLRLRIPDDPGPSSFDWASRVFSVQTSLEQFHLTVGAWSNFLLNSTTWRLWSNGRASSSASLDFSPWKSTPLSRYEAVINRRGLVDLGLFAPERLAIEPRIITSLNSLAPELASLRVGSGWDADVLWPDLDAAIEAFSSLSSLTTLHLKGSLTPTYHSLTRVVACSQICFDALATTHPILHAAAELVGGFQAFRSLQLEINFARFRKIVAGIGIASPENGGRGETLVRWEVANSDGWVLGYDATVRMEGEERVVSMRETEGGRSSPSPKALSCTVCSQWKLRDSMDPVVSIMACEAGEVRAALKAGGFDLDALDSRSPPLATEISPFESFLRSV